MAKLKREDLNSLTVSDLKQKLQDDTSLLQKLKFNHSVTPLDNPMQIKITRREIARLKTEIRKRELASAK